MRFVGMPGFEPGVTRSQSEHVSRYTTSRFPDLSGFTTIPHICFIFNGKIDWRVQLAELPSCAYLGVEDLFVYYLSILPLCNNIF